MFTAGYQPSSANTAYTLSNMVFLMAVTAREEKTRTQVELYEHKLEAELHTHYAQSQMQAQSTFTSFSCCFHRASAGFCLGTNQQQVFLHPRRESTHQRVLLCHPAQGQSGSSQWVHVLFVTLVQVRAMWTISVSVCIGTQKVRGSVEHLSKCLHCLSHWYTSMGSVEHLSKCMHGLLFVCIGTQNCKGKVDHLCKSIVALAHKTV